MRWGILFNLAVILTVSGVLLFLVFSASLQRSVVDAKVREVTTLGAFIENELETAESANRVWTFLLNVCRARSGLGVVLYDSSGRVLMGCGLKRDADPPDPTGPSRRVKVVDAGWMPSLLRGSVVAMDVVKPFPHEVNCLRLFIEVPPAVSAPAWRFFSAYLILTQAALFLLGYLLFHRTVIGPVREAARLAARASGITEPSRIEGELSSQGDIKKISVGLRSMIVRIVEDREKMETLIGQLRKTNADLSAAQQGLIRSEKLAGVGRLAAGLAHEIGNPLQILIGYAELLQRGADPLASADIVRRMDQELQRIHGILRHLLDFARPIRGKVAPCRINDLVQDCGALIKGRQGFRHVKLEYALSPALPPIETDAEKVRQILVNLLFNASDAIPETGGNIVLRTRAAVDCLEIEIEDDGVGIPADHLDKVFDPFFTTKEPGKGTGLGLAVCLGLVESLGGTINVRSLHGHGTIVLVTLPLDKKPAPPG